MLIVALLVLAAGGWIYAAAGFQDHGYAWADQTCASVQGLCNSPNLVFGAAVAAVVILIVVHTVRSS
jgi:hypothetical protein